MYLKKINLKNKTALVTGAGKGIGKACSIALAEAGANLIIISRTKKDLDKVSRIIKKFKSKCYILVDPFKKVQDRNRFLSRVKKTYPGEKKYIIAVNNYKGRFPNQFKLIYSTIGSKTRTLKIFEIS